MLSLSQVFGDATAEEPLSRWVPYDRFIAPGVFSTTTGPIGMTMELAGLDYETLGQDELEKLSEQLARGLRIFDENFRLYNHCIKRSGQSVIRAGEYENLTAAKAVSERVEFLEKAGLSSIRLFLTVVLEAPTDGTKLPGFFNPKWLRNAISSDVRAILTTDLNFRVRTLTEAVGEFSRTLGKKFGIRILNEGEIFEHLCLLVNPDAALLPKLKYGNYLGYFGANSEIQQRQRWFDWAGYETRVFVVKEEPSETFAHMLRQLLKIESNFTFTSEWKRKDNFSMKKRLNGKRKQFWSDRFTAEKDAAAHGIKDSGATDRAESMNDAIRNLKLGVGFFGEYSLTVVVFDHNAERLTRSATALRSVFRDQDATLLEEQKHRFRSFLSTIPGNSGLNLRYRFLYHRNYCDLAMIFKPQLGQLTNKHLKSEYLSVFESTDKTPYYLNLHVGKVAHTLVTGATSGGKSVVLNQLIEDSQKNPGQRTFIIDVGGSYRALTKKYGGTYISVSLKDRNFHLNPFRRARSPHSVNTIRRLLMIWCRQAHYRLLSRETQQLTEAIEEVYTLPERRRRLGCLSLPKELMQVLNPWINGGTYAHLFDNEQDDLQASDWSTWDFTELEKVPQVLAPLMFYQFDWIQDIVQDLSLAKYPKALWCDEAWRLAGTVMRKPIRMAVKTWRKYNAWVVFATQGEIDLRATKLLEVLNESCPTKIFLPNAGADLKVYGDTFKLTPKELELLEQMQLGEMLIKRPGESVRANLQVSASWLHSYDAQFSDVLEENRK